MVQRLVCFPLIFALVLGPNVCCCAVHEVLGLLAGSGGVSSTTQVSDVLASDAQASDAQASDALAKAAKLDPASVCTNPKPCCQAKKSHLPAVAAEALGVQANSFGGTCCRVQDPQACQCSRDIARLGSREQEVAQFSVKPTFLTRLWFGVHVVVLRDPAAIVSAARRIPDKPGRAWSVQLGRWTC